MGRPCGGLGGGKKRQPSEGTQTGEVALIPGSLNGDVFGHQKLVEVAPTLASLIRQSTGSNTIGLWLIIFSDQLAI